MAQVISVLNFKGGVGKTTTVAHLGTALWILGYKVLLIDTDSQRNLTYNMNFDGTEGDATFHEWIISRRDDFPAPVYRRYPGLDFIPSSRNLFEAEEILSPRRMRESVLQQKLDPLRRYYDYILIDCSPTEGLLNFNSMVASDQVFVPLECSSFSLQGLQTISDAIKEVLSTPFKDNLEILGVLPVKYDRRTKISRRSMEVVNEYFPGKLLKSFIRPSIKFNECVSKRMTNFEYDCEGNGAEDYMTLAEELTGKQRPDNWQRIACDAFAEKFPEKWADFEKELFEQKHGWKEKLKSKKNVNKE